MSLNRHTESVDNNHRTKTPQTLSLGGQLFQEQDQSSHGPPLFVQ
jgi:hypothetical protein